MVEQEVRIVQLPPLRVAAALGFGPEPELQAWHILSEWRKSAGLEAFAGQRYFGFNNPGPSEGSPNYGYEQWLTVPAGTQASGEVVIKDFSGGPYAVMACEGVPMPDKWQQLVAWAENNAYRMGRHQWLEECLTPEPLLQPAGDSLDVSQLRFDLYLPVIT